VFETAKIDVPTDPSQVLDYRTVALQCPKNPRASWAVTRESATHTAIAGSRVSGKLLIYAGSANPCNAQKHPTAHLMSSKAVRVRSSALCLPAKRAKMGSAQYSYRRLCQRHVSNRPSPRATVVGQKPLLLWGPPMPKAAFYNGADENRARRGRGATSSWGAKGVRSRSEGPCFEDCMYRLLGS
jgi:hypothetical protein